MNNYLLYILIFIFISYVIFTTKYLEKKLPKKFKKIKEEAQKKEREKIKQEIEREKQQRKKVYKKQEIKNIENGKKYEAEIAKYFRNNNYIVWEHGKEKGLKDNNIDLFVMNDKEAFFVQCKYYKKSQVDHNMVKATRSDIRSYMLKNKEFTNLIKNRTKKILYVIPRACLTKGAYKYIKENNDIIDFKIIPTKEI